MGLDKVPTVRIEQLNEAQKRAYVIADNKLAENAGWDEELLTVELRYLAEIDVDFDVTITGFETPEIDLLFEAAAPDGDALEDDALPREHPDEPIVSRVDDLWNLGRHRLLCGDATRAQSFDRLMGRAEAEMVFTDPPYNVPIDGNVCGSGAIKHADFVMASGEMSPAEYCDFLRSSFANLAASSIDGSIHYVCMDWRHLGEIIAAGKDVYGDMKNLCIWVKSNAGMGSFYRSQHELVLVFKNGTAPHVNNIRLGEHGRYRTNVWNYPGLNAFGSNRLDELRLHPTVKPVALVADAIKDSSSLGGIVLDSFAGSGTTVIAAEQAGRVCHAMELDPKHVDTAIRRWEAYSNEMAIHAESELTFADLADARRGAMRAAGPNRCSVDRPSNDTTREGE